MARIIDLTLTVSPRLRGVEFEQLHTVEQHGWNTRTLHLYSHSGTHMDAQLHFAAGDGTIDRMTLNRCLGPAWVVDLSRLEPRSAIGVEHLGELTTTFKPGESLLLRTDWCQYVDRPEVYRDGLPRVGLDLARWCVEKRVRMLGVEPPSVADVNNLEEVTAIHRTLLGGEVIIVEGLANLKAVERERVLFAAIPLKIEGGDGSPCRAFAIEGAFLPELEAATS